MNVLLTALLVVALALLAWLAWFLLPYVAAALVIVAAYSLAACRALKKHR